MRRFTPGIAVSALILLVYGGVWAAFDGLTFPVQRDELHFWPTALTFSTYKIPTLELLRGYTELNTPLPFMLWGWFERWFTGGIVAARHINFALSLLMTGVVAWTRRPDDWSPALAVIGLLLFPYYLGTALFAYTDVIAALSVVAGTAAHLARRFLLSLLLFLLAVSSRQSMVAFPAALLLHELYESGTVPTPHWRWAAPLLACVGLGGWFLVFGGFAPPGALEVQPVPTASALTVYPQHGLYLLSIVGIYFALPERILFRDVLGATRWRTFAHGMSMLLMLALFVAWPPLQNVNAQYGAATMGYTDKFIRLFAPDWLRIAVFWLAATFAVLRFLREPLPLILLGTNAAILTKAHLAWDKYAIALIAVLWLLRSRGLMEGHARIGLPLSTTSGATDGASQSAAARGCTTRE